MVACIEKISTSDEVWICGPYRDSLGVKAEIAFCKAADIPYQDLSHLWNGIEIDLMNMFYDMKEFE